MKNREQEKKRNKEQVKPGSGFALTTVWIKTIEPGNELYIYL